jgi:two-component system sensor histidine kinase PilS (NtrC family)
VLTDFLVYARTAPVYATKVELVSVVGETIELLRQNPRFSGTVSLNFETEQPMIYVVADQDQVTQVVINLVTNAVEAVDRETGSVSVTIATPVGKADESATEWTCLRVADNGCGFGVADRERIFEPFFSKKKGGTGLGLAIVKRCLDNVDARIEVESTPGEGTTFTVLFKKYLLPSETERIAEPFSNSSIAQMLP